MKRRDKLQDLFAKAPRFSFFDELMNIPLSSAHLQTHEYLKINKIIDDIYLYLSEIYEIFNSIINPSTEEDLHWFLEGRDGILELHRNMENIDSIISQLLTIVDNNHQMVESNLLDKFELASDILLEVKKFVIIYKKNLDIAMNYYEINDGIIKSLTQEIEDCLKAFFKLSDIKLSITRNIHQFDLQAILVKLKITDAITDYSMKSIRLPTFNDYDEQLYQEYLLLTSKISPLKISLTILPLKIDELNKMCSGGLFPNSRLTIINNYEKLLERWNYLLLELKKLKLESLDSKWHEIFNYLILQIIDKCEELIDIDENINEEVAATYRLCSNLMNIINQSIKDCTIYDEEIIKLYSQSLLPKWFQVIEKITNLNPSQLNPSQQSTQSSSVKLDSNGLRTFNTKRSSVIEECPAFSPNINGFGLGLGVNIESVKQNYSIKKMDKVQDFFQYSSPPPLLPSSKSLRQSLQSIDQDDFVDLDNDDVMTLVTRTPKLSIDDKIPRHFNVEELMEWLATPTKPSCLPFMCQDYFERGLPIIKKAYHEIPTRIPSISPEHPVFYSPDHIGLGLAFTPNNGSPKQRGGSGYSGDSMKYDHFDNGKIPSLLYDDDISMSFNSTSPERPPSSMGSRFDDAHLVQPFRTRKSSWKG